VRGKGRERENVRRKKKVITKRGKNKVKKQRNKQLIEKI
jgi:hypothetical protein